MDKGPRPPTDVQSLSLPLLAADADGDPVTVLLRNLPDGAVVVKVWHPFLKGVGQILSRPLTLKGAAQQAFTLDLRDPPASMSSMRGMEN